MHKTRWTFTLLLGLPILVGCYVPTEAPAMSAEVLQVRCTPVTGADGTISVRVNIENASDTTLHIFDSGRMPYVLEEDGDLLILYGVNSPDPDREYFMIEIPPTQPLRPGERIEDEVRLSPILDPPDEQHVRNISRLRAWQKLSRSAAIQVQFP